MIDLEKIRRIKKITSGRFLRPENSRFLFFFDRIFAAANAAATARLSVGNEKVFRNFTSGKCYEFLIFRACYGTKIWLGLLMA